MDTKISIPFYGKKAKTTTDNLLPIYLRVTVSGKRFELSTHRYIAPGKWSVEAGRVKGNTEEARRINAHLPHRPPHLRHHRHALQRGAD